MPDQAGILTRAIQKAQANGWGLLGSKFDVDVWHNKSQTLSEPYVKEYKGEIYERAIPWQVIVFNHEFAKAIWGEPNMGSRNFRLGWQEHLKRMVVNENPIDYLAANL